MNHAYLLIGGNLGDRWANLDRTRTLIVERCGSMFKHSSVYETAAWGKEDQPDFLNQVLLIDTDFDAQKLLQEILQIEHDLGRYRNEKYGPRVIDIDILLYNDDIINEAGLQVPHPRMGSRRFVLTPLAEIAGNLVHPVSRKTILQMLNECKDPLTVEKKSM